MPSTSEKYNLNCSSSVVCGIIKKFSFACMWEALGFQHFLPVSSFDHLLQITKSRGILRGQCLIRGTRRVHAHHGYKHSRLSEMGWFNTQTLQLSQVGCQGNRPRGSLNHRKFTQDAFRINIHRSRDADGLGEIGMGCGCDQGLS